MLQRTPDDDELVRFKFQTEQTTRTIDKDTDKNKLFIPSPTPVYQVLVQIWNLKMKIW